MRACVEISDPSLTTGTVKDSEMELKMVSARISQKLERNNKLKSEMSKLELEMSQVL